MAFRYAGTLAITDPEILINKWKVVLIEPTTHEELGWAIVNSDGATPIDWDIVTSNASGAYLIIEPLIDRIWYVEIEMEMGLMVMPDDPNNPFLYEITGGSGYWNTGIFPVDWPTTPGESVTKGELTYTCIGQRVQPQIEGPVWGEPYEES